MSPRAGLTSITFLSAGCQLLYYSAGSSAQVARLSGHSCPRLAEPPALPPLLSPHPSRAISVPDFAAAAGGEEQLMPEQRPGPAAPRLQQPWDVGCGPGRARGAGTAQRTRPSAHGPGSRLGAGPGVGREGISEGEVAPCWAHSTVHPRGESSPPPTLSRAPPAQERSPMAKTSLMDGLAPLSPTAVPPPLGKISILLPSLKLQ